MNGTREARCRAIYNSVEAKVNTMGENVLKLVRNPEATPEHLAQAHKAYSAAYELFAEVRADLQGKYPGYRHPWSCK